MQREEFHKELVRLVTITDTGTQELSEEFDASIPTVCRWLSGLRAPTEAVRILVINFLERKKDQIDSGSK